MRRYIPAFLAAAMAAVSGFAVHANPAASAGTPAASAKQLEFGSPQDAFGALVNSAASNNTNKLLAIFGPDGKDIISSGDPIADMKARARFVNSVSHGVTFRRLNENTVLVLVGKDGWTFPIPIIKKRKFWLFDTNEGKQEILNRRIGRNELNTVRVSLAYVAAQRKYAQRALSQSGHPRYAQSFIGRHDLRDGLYWPGKAGSPLGPLFARAGQNNISGRKVGRREPYYGYYFKILEGQGKHAPGGAMDYVVNGRMTAGFGLVAYPAKYGVSGIMTFIVNQCGVLYEKDLGPGTEGLASKITLYDPDKTWKKMYLMNG